MSDADQVSCRLSGLDINNDLVSLVLTENFVGDSTPPIGRQTNVLDLKLEFPQKNNASLP